jgi:hypothetical protein
MPAKGTSLIYGKKEQVIDKEFLKRLKLEYPEIQMSEKEIKQLCKDANSIIADSIINDTSGFKFPNFLGYVSVAKYKASNPERIFNLSVSAKYKKAVPMLNLHSFGYMFKFCYFSAKPSKVDPVLTSYKFRPSRVLNRAFAKHIKETSGQQYFTIKEIKRIFISLKSGLKFR